MLHEICQHTCAPFSLYGSFTLLFYFCVLNSISSSFNACFPFWHGLDDLTEAGKAREPYQASLSILIWFLWLDVLSNTNHSTECTKCFQFGISTGANESSWVEQGTRYHDFFVIFFTAIIALFLYLTYCCFVWYVALLWALYTINSFTKMKLYISQYTCFEAKIILKRGWSLIN